MPRFKRHETQSELHVTFPDRTPAVVFWGHKAGKHEPEWLVGRKDGTMVSMRHEHGPSAPITWVEDTTTHNAPITPTEADEVR